MFFPLNYESQPGSWLVVICERSENRGSGGEELPQGAQNVVNRWCFRRGKSIVFTVMYHAAKQ